MKLLTGPYGYGSGTHVSLRRVGAFKPEAITKVLTGWSCWPPAIPKILACLEHSRRYDCVLQSAWFDAAKNGAFRHNLHNAGLELVA